MAFITKLDLARYENATVASDEKSNFALSFSMLPKEERDAINSVYSFCSYIDDIVDEPNDAPDPIKKKLERLHWWENAIHKFYAGHIDSKLLAPFEKLTDRYKMPKQYFITLIDGCKRDLTQNRYRNFEELKEYCYGVASIVGLMSIEIFGYKYEETKNYAINLGYALQLTNIIRDVKFDKERNYIYLPQDELNRFNYSEADIFDEVYNDNFIELMRFQAKRAREYYHKARTALHPDERATIFAAEIMDAIYYRLLEKIELNEFRIFEKKIRVSSPHKMYIAFKHWTSARLLVDRIKKKSL
jgi:phytoene synthase